MAKIDITKIEGYSNMSAEEKLAALEGFELPEPDYSGYVKKDLLDKANSEAAQFKRQLREKMSEDEALKAKQAEDMEAMKAELETLRREKVVDSHTTKFLGLGYSEKLARDTAEAMAAGEMDKVFKNHATFLVDREKALKAELLKNTPTPPAGEGSQGTSKEQFQKMSLADKQKFAAEHPNEYKAMYATE